MSPSLSKFPQDITSFSIGSFSSSFDTFCFCSCVYHNTLLIDTNTTNFNPSQLHTNGFDILTSHIDANGLEPLIDRLVLM
jgi:hypothetical protein